MDSDYVDFGSAVRKQLGQSQYASRWVRPAALWIKEGYRDLSDGLRIQGEPENYHSLRIHKDDAAEFIRRVKEAKK